MHIVGMLAVIRLEEVAALFSNLLHTLVSRGWF
jgi:hypothetical protein